MRLCECRVGPLRDSAHPNQLRCFRCGWWTAHGALSNQQRVHLEIREAISILDKLADDYAWAHGLSFAPPKLGNGLRRLGASDDGEGVSIDYADPTGDLAANRRRLRVRAYTTIAARLLERIMRDVRSADDAIGEALLAAEPPGPVDHTKAPFHDTGGLRYPDPAVYDAQTRRRGRGEAIPT